MLGNTVPTGPAHGPRVSYPRPPTDTRGQFVIPEAVLADIGRRLGARRIITEPIVQTILRWHHNQRRDPARIARSMRELFGASNPAADETLIRHILATTAGPGGAR